MSKTTPLDQDEEVRHTSKHQVQQNQIASQNHGWLGWSPGDPGALVLLNLLRTFANCDPIAEGGVSSTPEQITGGRASQAETLETAWK